jgi:hypothetical protein
LRSAVFVGFGFEREGVFFIFVIGLDFDTGNRSDGYKVNEES